MPHAFEQKLADNWPPAAWKDVTVLAAVSGGPDSVALLHALAALKTAGEGRLAAAHANHQLRPGEADADQALVVGLCQKLGVPCHVARIKVRGAREGGEGLEAAARRARYAFLQQTAATLGARYVVTAHTADDQAETIVHRILRGTGVRGLSGMARARALGPATLLRPMLNFRRAEILDYLSDLGQPFRHDSSNRDVRFTRNRIRHELLPVLAEQFNPKIIESLLRLCKVAREAQDVIDSMVDDLSARCVRPAGPDRVAIDTASLAAKPRYLVRELLAAIWRRQGWPMQAMGFQEWDLLADMVDPREAPSPALRSKQSLPGDVLAETTEGEMRLTRRRESKPEDD